MKTNPTLKALTAALLLAAAPSPAHAASLLRDGDFDSLPVGTAPDKDKPAGYWIWPADYLLDPTEGVSWAETAAPQLSIAPAPGGGIGNALRLSFGPTEKLDASMHLPNLLTRRVTRSSGEIIHTTFDIYVAPGHAGGSVYLGNGFNHELNQRGPQLSWHPDGQLNARNSSGADTTLIASYPRGIWQTVRLKVDLVRQRFDFYWGEKGQPASVIRTNLAFRSSPLPDVDRFQIARFRDVSIEAQSYFDNIQVTTDPAIAPVSADLAAGGSTTLQVVNLPAGDATIQWRRNGQDIDGATAATLELGNVTTEQAGIYTAVITRDGQSLTTEASTVRVFDRLTITTPPQAVSLPSGKATGFSVAATGPLPMTYQWRRNGVDLPGKTSRFLTLTATAAAGGDYTVVVSDANGSVESDPAPLTVLVNPTFTQAPISMRVVAGSSVTFSAAVAGTGPFTYQWRNGSSFDSSTIRATETSAGTTAFFTLDNVQAAQGGTYRLFLANPAVPNLSSSSPSRSFTLTVLPDTDGDGLPDEWETAHGLDPASAADASLDGDGDGQSNLAEYQSGTVPTSAASALRLDTVTHAAGQAAVSFPAAATRTYTVEWKADAAGGSWQKLADVVAQAADHPETVTDTAAGTGARFYRVVTPRRP